MMPKYRSAEEPRTGEKERKKAVKEERGAGCPPPAEMHYPEHELAWVGTSLKMGWKKLAGQAGEEGGGEAPYALHYMMSC